jgi:hypothetical protein
MPVSWLDRRSGRTVPIGKLSRRTFTGVGLPPPQMGGFTNPGYLTPANTRPFPTGGTPPVITPGANPVLAPPIPLTPPATRLPRRRPQSVFNSPYTALPMSPSPLFPATRSFYQLSPIVPPSRQEPTGTGILVSGGGLASKRKWIPPAPRRRRTKQAPKPRPYN